MSTGYFLKGRKPSFADVAGFIKEMNDGDDGDDGSAYKLGHNKKVPMAKKKIKVVSFSTFKKKSIMMDVDEEWNEVKLDAPFDPKKDYVACHTSDSKKKENTNFVHLYFNEKGKLESVERFGANDVEWFTSGFNCESEHGDKW